MKSESNAKFCNAEAVAGFHCPRYAELPDIELYMDQVISIIENRLSIFSLSDKEKIISPSMVNNYVKQKVIPPPKNKKYSKEHLAYLFCICILKKILSISEIGQLVRIQRESWPVELAYDRFCAAVETAVKAAFGSCNFSKCLSGNDDASKILRSAALSFANRIYLERLIADSELFDKKQK